jgi:hypothetical protein
VQRDDQRPARFPRRRFPTVGGGFLVSQTKYDPALERLHQRPRSAAGSAIAASTRSPHSRPWVSKYARSGSPDELDSSSITSASSGSPLPLAKPAC